MRFTPQVRDLAWLVERPIAHRGLHDRSNGILENTESAFAAAIRNNYAIECDLQITADGDAVVFHDETLQRVCEAEGMVRDCTVKSLKSIAYRIGKDRIQTLAELLEQVAGKVPLIIELKSHWDGDDALARRALKVLEDYEGPYAIMSFDPDLVAAVAEYSPFTVRGITADRAVDSYYNVLSLDRRLEMRTFAHLHRTRPHFVSFYFRELPYAPVQRIRAAGHPVITWTIRNEEQARMARRYSDQITFEGFAA
ncbi:MAG: glycerophosphodiester phosphodiesterase [Rhizobiales bacterium]|nr:glycerophosphodiester phosphodiesterase [Hyphomicrobiales bacterium]